MTRARRQLAALALLVASPAAAATDSDSALWINGTVMGSLSGRLIYFAEVQPRIGLNSGTVDQLLLRPAIGWRVTDDLSAYLGYARVLAPAQAGPDPREDRLFLQLSWTLARVGGGALSSRTRVERRAVEPGRDIGWRVRQMLRYVRPLGRPERVRALASVEPFVALDDTDWGARRGLDQLRSFAGVEVPLAGRSTVELGYLNQLVNRRGGDRRVNHVASVALFIRP